MPLSEQFTNIGINPGRMAPLSVHNAGTEPVEMGPESYASSNQAGFLVKALKEFIVPIIYAQAPGLATNQMRNTNDNTNRLYLGPEAQNFVDALENFIASLVKPHLVEQDEMQIMEVRKIRENRVLIPPKKRHVGRSQFIPLSFQSKSTAPAQPRLLKLALEAGRNRVFNKMPIRLLTFKSDGSGIIIMDRSTIWDRISTSIETGFNKHEMNSDNYRQNPNSDAEKEAIEEFVSQYTRYAILSHCWLYEKPGEVTYADWKSGNFDIDSPGYKKLSQFCQVAAEEHGITLAWMDTICINKDSSAELDESIRSMFKWYRDASICITYLAHTTTSEHIRNDAWFTRGWTLQELLAPRRLKFYGADWQTLCQNSPNDKEDFVIQNEIAMATTITPIELTDRTASTCISRKMQWAANRRVTREEDTAYSLMGIFNVSISIAYGEGAERAFFRLVQQILNSKGQVQDVMNWGYGPEVSIRADDGSTSLPPISSLIPSSPQQYLWRTPNPFVWPLASIPVTFTHLGLHLSILLMPASFVDPTSQVFSPIGNYYSTITINEVNASGSNSLQRYTILDSMAGRHNPAAAGYPHYYPVTFGVLNFTTSENSVAFPLTLDGIIGCFAIGLYFGDTSPADAAARKIAYVIRTQSGIAFELHQRQPTAALSRRPWHSIPKTDLKRHGMQLLDMYL